MIDEDLRELEEKVHDVTGWEDCNVEYNISKGVTVYHYNSDYILEKLPKRIVKDDEVYWLSIYPLDRKNAWGVGYDSGDEKPSNLSLHSTWADGEKPTLKALLRLYLALKEAGEL